MEERMAHVINIYPHLFLNAGAPAAGGARGGALRVEERMAHVPHHASGAAPRGDKAQSSDGAWTFHNVAALVEMGYLKRVG